MVIGVSIDPGRDRSHLPGVPDCRYPMCAGSRCRRFDLVDDELPHPGKDRGSPARLARPECTHSRPLHQHLAWTACSMRNPTSCRRVDQPAPGRGWSPPESPISRPRALASLRPPDSAHPFRHDEHRSYRVAPEADRATCPPWLPVGNSVPPNVNNMDSADTDPLSRAAS